MRVIHDEGSGVVLDHLADGFLVNVVALFVDVGPEEVLEPVLDLRARRQHRYPLLPRPLRTGDEVGGGMGEDEMDGVREKDV